MNVCEQKFTVKHYFYILPKVAVNKQWRYIGVWINISYCVGITWKT